MGHVDFFGIAPELFILNYYNGHLFYKELNSLHRSLKIINIFNIKVDHICGPQHRGGLDAGDTDSVDLTPANHGPHRMIVNKRQTSANMVTKYLNYHI